MSALLGAIEAGGTKVSCVVARDAATILAAARVATTTPAATLGAVEDFFGGCAFPATASRGWRAAAQSAHAMVPR